MPIPESPAASATVYDLDAERLNLALAASRLGDWSWDAKTDIVTLSPRAAEIFGVEPGPQMTWEAMRELLHPDDREAARLAVDKAVADRGDYSIEYRLVNGGRERWVLASGRGRYDGEDVLGMIGVVQNVTSDRLLVHIDDALRPLVKPEEITFTAAKVLGQHLGVNRCAYCFVEDDEDTFILTGNYTSGVRSIVGTYRFRQFGAECLRSMRAGEAYVVEDSVADPRLDEEDRKAYAFTEICGVICVPILKAGRFVAAMAVHTSRPRKWTTSETTLVQRVASRCWESIERARVEREREGLLEAAQAANRAKDEFLAMLGHELRNPLAPIVTALHLMKSEPQATSVKERTIIERQVNHLVRLVDDLLDVSRIARGKVELKLELVELFDVMTSAVEVVSPLLEERSHRLALEVPRTGCQVRGDATRLTQVCANLLTNAAKYTPHGGRITVSAERVGSAFELRVSDNGIGMSPDTLAHAFELFVQGRQSIDRARGGLGLGLTIVKSLVERHGGTVSARSAGEGRGSEFVVRLPAADTAAKVAALPAEPLPSSPHAAAAGARVLVVDDNQDAAEMLAAVLEACGYRVHVAHDGPDALRLAATHGFDAALLDIGLPVMDGYELAERLKKLPNMVGARLIAVTGYGQESDKSRARDAGFADHLVKPVDLETLQATLGRR